jgi:rhodanese-related sulfurtransferase/N-acetylglutamate synthase-like GNAT family acetyltransferase
VTSARVRPLQQSDALACDAIIASLPDWFANEDGLQQCSRAVRSEPGWVVEHGDGVIAFLTIQRPKPRVAEISWMAVHADHRGAGHGRILLETLVAQLHAEEARFLAVKTLSDRDPDPSYAHTRAFYEAMGFVPVMDLDIWGPENPAMLLMRTVAAPSGREPSVPAPTVDDLLAAARVDAERLTPTQAHDELVDGAVVIDQRTLEQRTEHGDIPGAIPVSMTVVPWKLDPMSPWKLPQIIDHDTRVIVVCQQGYSSSLSAAWLRDFGMRRIADVAGGFEAWRDADLPIAPLESD